MVAKSKSKKKKKELTIWDWMARSMAVSAFIGIIWAGFQIPIAYGEWKQREVTKVEALKEVTFDNSKQKHDVIEHSEIEFSPVKVFQRADSLAKRQDTLIDQQEKIKEFIIRQNSLLDSIRQQNINRDIYDIEMERKRQISRESRSTKMDAILKLLDTTQNK